MQIAIGMPACQVSRCGRLIIEVCSGSCKLCCIAKAPTAEMQAVVMGSGYSDMSRPDVQIPNDASP